jgi:hypothetical protein
MVGVRAAGRALATLAMIGAVAISGLIPFAAAAADLDPLTLPRGADPAVPVLIGDTIHTGGRRIEATTRGQHIGLWRTSRGYVVHDVLSRNRSRLTYVGIDGGRRVLATFTGIGRGVSVSAAGHRIAWSRELGDTSFPTMVTVANPDTGRVIAKRRFYFAPVFGVTGHRVLITRKTPGTDFLGATWWWNYRSDTFTKVSHQHADSASILHDRVLFSTGASERFCGRVSRLSHPRRTLWRTCRSGMHPEQWSPNGERALATHNYFDDAGTDRWLVVDDPTGNRTGRVTGRLDWDAVWEGNRHFLVIAQNSDGIAAIVRCDVTGRRCERASRTWDMGPVDSQPNYVAPPVVFLTSDGANRPGLP